VVDARRAEDVTEARHRFVTSLRQVAPDCDLEAAELTFSELLGNVHRHAPGLAWVSYERTGSRLELTVADHGATFVPPSGDPPDASASEGRGLSLVSALAGPIRVARKPDGWKTVRVSLGQKR
jgi:anti-sigma regulatory factor (Ser/Thr protein kinase)